ncbi:MAG: carboxypeptidase regulatory-like domain-containing protein, partial [Vicinamibacterales bacterium]
TDGNAVNAALSQFGSRIVILGLRDPVGPFVPRRLSLSGVRDLRGQTMAPVVEQPIVPDPNIGTGAVVTGRVLRADGTGVGGALVSYIQLIQDPLGRLVEHIISVKPADEDGRYAFDFVLQNHEGPFILRARDPSTDEEASLTTRVRVNGERLALDLVLLGRGTVEGTVRDRNGAAIAFAFVNVRSLTDFSVQQVQTDQHGFYRVTGVPVGPVGIEAIAPIGQARASGLILASGRTTTVDVVIFGATPGVVTGEVRLPSGAPAAGISVFLAPGEGSIFGGVSGQAVDAMETSDTGTFRFENVAPGQYVAIAIDQAFGLAGQARFSVTSLNSATNPAFVAVLLAGTGSVAGRVLELVGGVAVPVPGALVAGGTEIVTADAEGRYLIPAVPVGVRTIEAAHPASGARGSRQVTILAAGQASSGIDIVLNALARVTGQLVDAAGQPVAGQEVRIVVGETFVGEGRRFFVRRTTTAADGSYEFDRLEPREYPIAAVRGDEVANGRARLAPLVLHDIVNLRFVRGTGRVSGRVVDDTGLAVAARVAIRARAPNAAGILEFTDAGTVTSDPDRGFTFTGLFPGPFTLSASSFFSPDTASASGVLPDANPVAENITLTLARNTGRLQGCVLTPEGEVITPVLDESGVPRPLPVFITSRLLRNELEGDQNPEPDGIRVDASTGCFVSSIPLPPDFYTIQVTDDRPGSPTLGLTGQATAMVERGADTIQDVRLLGLGAIGVEVVDATGNPLRGVNVTARRTSYPNDVRDALVVAPTVGAPFVFDEITEGPIVVMAVVSTDPAVDVGGRDDLRGFGGSATGEVVRGATTVIRVTVDAAGTVSGRFVRPGGTGLVANAQVTLTSATADVLFAVTDGNGAFRFDGIATGSFSIEGFEPASGRRARAQGEIQVDGQHVILDLELGPIGRVHGIVVDVTRTQPIAGADVRLVIPEEGERAVTSRLDGTFSFESIPGGTFSIVASAGGLAGRAEVTIAAEGDDIEVLVALEGSGRVEGTVRSAAGIPVAASDVTLVASSGARRTIQAGAAGPGVGTFAFDVVPVGLFTVEARPPGALTPGDGGRSTGAIDTAGQVVTTDVTFQGTIIVGATVTGASGPAPVDVLLQSTGLFGGTMFPTTVEDGVFLFEGVPRAALTVSARQVAPSGVTLSASAGRTESELPPPGERLVPDVMLSLSQVATVTGLVSSESGQPVSLARVTLISTQLMVVGVTDADGRFEFVGVPLSAPLTLSVEGPAGGRAVFTGAIDSEGVVRDSQGQPHAMIALTLDATPPGVQTTSPLPGATAVATGAAIVITFNEPIDPTSVSTCPASVAGGPSIRLLESGAVLPDPNDPLDPCDDSNVVPLSSAVSADGRTVTLTPQRALASVTQHTLALSSGTVDGDGMPVGGIRDLVGLSLPADFIAQFVTIDDVSPRVLLMSPAHGSVNVPEESLVRITFSEPIAAPSVTTASIVLSGPGGPLAATRDLILGNTVVVLTPTDGAGTRLLLESNTTYTVTVAGVSDFAGNLQRAQDTVVVTFSTRDTIPPVIASIEAPGDARVGQVITIVARSAALDIASVELFVDGALSAISATPTGPGEFSMTLTMPAHAVQVAARATDASGNTGPMSAAVTVALVPDDPPSIAITAPPAGTTVTAGTTVRFAVEATDDVAVAEIRAATSGAVTTTTTRVISPPATPVEAFFDVEIPTGAAGGTVTFAVVAIDTAGQTSATASVAVSVEDAPPAIAGVEPAGGQQGQTLDVAITGVNTHFVQGATTVDFGLDIAVNSVTVAGATSLTANITIGAAAALGPRTVTATTDAESAQGVNAFTVIAGSAVLTALDPDAGRQTESLAVAITGQNTHFVQGVTTASFGGGIVVTSLAIVSPTSATANITIDAGASLGARTVTLTTGGESASIVNGFTVLAGAPRVTSVNPPVGRQGETLDVVVGGQFTSFAHNVTTASFGAGIAVNSVAVHGPTGAIVNITIDQDAALGSRTVTMTTGEEVAVLVGGFTVQAGQAGLESVNPVVGEQGQNLTVILTGRFTNFAQGVTTASFGPGIGVGTVTVNGPTLASVPISIATTAGIGPRTVTVVTAGEVAALANGFTVLPGTAAIAVIDPNTGRTNQNVVVNVTGAFTNWQNGVTTASFGPDISVGGAAEGEFGPVTVTSPTTLSAALAINASAPLGPRNVMVRTGGETLTVTGGFTVTEVDTTPPGVLTTSPANGAL